MRKLFFLWVIQGYAAFNLTWAVPAVNLDSNPPVGDTDVNATIAIDPLGNACATWGRTTGQNAVQDIWAALYNHSSRTWTGAIKISGDANAAHPQVVMDGSGNALFIWEEGFPSKIMSRTFSSSGVWSPALSLEPTTIFKSSNAQSFPEIAMNAAGHAAVIWTEFFNGSHHICSAKKLLGQTWTGSNELSSGVNDVVFNGTKSIAINSSGDGIAAWEEVQGNGTSVHIAQYTNGSWLTSSQVSVEHQAYTPAVAMGEDGSSVVVWDQSDVILSKKFVNGQPQDTRNVSDPAYKCIHPDVKMDQNGNAVAVFERSDSLHKFITGSTLLNGQSNWSAPTDISPPSLAMADEAGYPVLTLNAIGDGVVIWKEFDGTSMVIQGAGHSLGTWSFIKTLSTLGSHAGELFPGYDIAVAVNLSGNIIAIWPEDPTGDGSQQIKATTGVGLANVAPTPPIPDPVTIENGIASGYQTFRRFPAHLDVINVLSWSTNAPGAYYKIYRGNLSALIGTSNTMRYEDHQRVPKQKETYLITSVDENEQESSPMTLIVHPK